MNYYSGKRYGDFQSRYTKMQIEKEYKGVVLDIEELVGVNSRPYKNWVYLTLGK